MNRTCCSRWLAYLPFIFVTPMAMVAQGNREDLASLIAAELAFADHARREGQLPAFQAAFAPEGVVFVPAPMNGLEAYREPSPFSRATLEWLPQRAAVSLDGLLGYTTGPWQWTSAEDPARPETPPVVLFGQYVSVWQRASREAPWKMVADGGVPAAPDRFSGAVPCRVETAGPQPVAYLLPSLPLKMFRADFLQSVSQAEPTALARGKLQEHSLVLRHGATPIAGNAPNAGQLLQQPYLGRTYETTQLVEAPGLAYEYGTVKGEDGQPTGYVLRLWRVLGDEGWWIDGDAFFPAAAAP